MPLEAQGLSDYTFNEHEAYPTFLSDCHQPWRTYIETFTLMGLIGDLSGKRVVDLACGGGGYTRLIRQQGVAEVVGVDLSARMVELAREQEAEQRLGIEYVTGDARHLEPKGEVTHGRDFWKCFMDHPPIIGIECFK